MNPDTIIDRKVVGWHVCRCGRQATFTVGFRTESRRVCVDCKHEADEWARKLRQQAQDAANQHGLL